MKSNLLIHILGKMIDKIRLKQPLPLHMERQAMILSDLEIKDDGITFSIVIEALSLFYRGENSEAITSLNEAINHLNSLKGEKSA